MPSCKAFICGCAGTSLGSAEREFLRRERPWGLILFRRNVETAAQIRALAEDFRDCAGRADAPVLVDQEGGRVQRLGPPLWSRYPAAAAFGRLPVDLGEQAAKLGARLIAADLREAGISIDCLPVLDVPAPDVHEIIGDRAYSARPARVAALARAAMEGLTEGGVLPVVKHMPGHGRARADSHLELPVVTASRRDLEQSDFAPFRDLAEAPIGMTAHVVYAALDEARPATLSPKIVQDVIRGYIGFDGLLMTDDLSMRALRGAFQARARAAFAAGVDVVLHCNGDLEEMAAVAEASPLLAGRGLDRAERALALIAAPAAPIDRRAARETFEKLMSAVG